MIAQFDYSILYDPAAPVMEIGIGAVESDDVPRRITALVDSGADGTMIPIDILRAVGATFVERRNMRGVTGDLVRVNLYAIVVHISSHPIYGIRAVAIPSGAEAIVGRDVLNQLIVTLDGFAHSLEIST